MNYFQLVSTILKTAKAHEFVQEVCYGDIYEFENSGERKYANVVLTAQNATTDGDVTTYSFNLFATDRLTDDKSNKLEVQSLCKTILSQIMAKEVEDYAVTMSGVNYTFWTEKFNDLCAGCYVSFAVALPTELTCADDELFERVVKEINANGTYDVTAYDEVNVQVQTPEEILDKLVTTNATLANTNKLLEGVVADQSATAEELTANNASLTATNKSLTDDILPTLRNGLQSKTVQPNEQEQVITADEGYIGLKDVTVKQSEYVPTIKYLGSVSNSFKGEINAILDLSDYTSTNSMFAGCSLKKIPKIINTQNVTTMDSMFSRATSLKTIDISSWDTSSVTSMDSMFMSSNQIDLSCLANLDTSAVTNIGGMFAYWGVYMVFDENFLAIANWDTSRVKKISDLFYATGVKNADFTKWNFGNMETYRNGWLASNYVINLIGNHKLAEVEAGEIVCLRDFGKKVQTLYFGNDGLRYSTILAVAKGMYDRTELATGTLVLSTTAFNNCKTDIDTIPDADTIAAQQTAIRTICAAKNYTLSLV